VKRPTVYGLKADPAAAEAALAPPGQHPLLPPQQARGARAGAGPPSGLARKPRPTPSVPVLSPRNQLGKIAPLVLVGAATFSISENTVNCIDIVGSPRCRRLAFAIDLSVCAANECEVLHTRSSCIGAEHEAKMISERTRVAAERPAGLESLDELRPARPRAALDCGRAAGNDQVERRHRGIDDIIADLDQALAVTQPRRITQLQVDGRS
jgi:hypothetical protein